VCDDGTVLMDSSLILQFIEASAAQGRSLWPATREGLQRDVRVVGLALAACEKAVQGLYERQLRPADKQHAPWLHRVTKQLNAALQELEREWANASPASPPLPADCAFSQASITSAVAWQFIHSVQAEAACAATHPALAALSAALEASDVFKRHPPVGPGVQASAA
jgi:glutathione S-transferase